MRFALTLLLAHWLATAAFAAEPEGAAHCELQVLPATGERLLYNYLLGEVDRQSTARAADVKAALTSPEAMNLHASRLRAQLAQMLGDFPQRTPLRARTVGTIQCDGYRIERVIYESRPRHHVTANLYLPADVSRPVPGVIVPCGHSDNGKANAPYQSVCILLALRGCAALIYDPIGQGERNQLPDTTRHGTTEHTLIGLGALLVGRNTANYRVWDGLRSMDYLASRPEVDPERLGCTGNSGGGTLTTWLMAVDERIAVAAPSCFITTIPRLFTTIGPQDCEQHFPNQGAYGIDHTDFLTMRAPKPTLILAAEQDFFDIQGTRQAADEAAAVFTRLGYAERTGLFTYDDKHGFSQPRREAAVRWLRRWLSEDDRPVAEPPLKLQADADLQVTASGQVVREFADEQTVVDFNRQRAAELATARKATWQAMGDAARRATVRQVLQLPAESAPAPTVRRMGQLERDGYTIEKLALEPAEGIPLPALLAVPAGTTTAKRRAAVIVAAGRGKQQAAEKGGLLDQAVQAGKIVLAVDLRGYGETADEKRGGEYGNREFRTAMVAMHIGRPLVAQRVEDLLAARLALLADERVDPAAIELVASEGAATPALHAAAIEPGFHRLALMDGLDSWAEGAVAQPLAGQLIGHVVPGALRHYDLSDLRAMLGARLSGAAAP